jgi:hypothetical protein
MEPMTLCDNSGMGVDNDARSPASSGNERHARICPRCGLRSANRRTRNRQLTLIRRPGKLADQHGRCLMDALLGSRQTCTQYRASSPQACALRSRMCRRPFRQIMTVKPSAVSARAGLLFG